MNNKRIDPDNDSLVLEYLYDGYVPEENGIFITNKLIYLVV